MKPNDVNKKNEVNVWNTLFRHRYSELLLLKYKIGDSVRISKYKFTFTKGCEANFMEDLFKIVKFIRGDPDVYELGEPMIGKFYEEELSAVEKILTLGLPMGSYTTTN